MTELCSESTIPTYDYIEGGVKIKGGFFKRNIILKWEDITNFRANYKNTGIFLSAYRFENPKQSGKIFGDLYFDLDTELDDNSDFDKIKTDAIQCIKSLGSMFDLKETDCEIYFSGNKGFHIIVPNKLLGIQPMEQLNLIFRKIAEDINGTLKYKTMDMKVYDRRRLWRVKNSKHDKSGLYKIPITYKELQQLSLQEIKELAGQQRFLLSEEEKEVKQRCISIFNSYVTEFKLKHKPREFNPNAKIEVKDAPQCINTLLNGNVMKGQRNNSAIAIASYFKQTGMSQDDCMEKLMEWNQNKCQEPLPQREIDMVVDHIYSAGYTYGCQGLKALAECDPDNCPLNRRR